MRMKLSNLERTFIEAKVHDVTVDGHDDDQALRDLEIEKPPQRAVTSRDAIAMEKCIVFTEHMMCLLQQLNGEKCVGQDVDATLFTKKTYVGTYLVVSWNCSSGHFGGRWASQPTCDNPRAGNLLLASAILLSGNSFTKVGLPFKFLNLQYFSSTLTVLPVPEFVHRPCSR